MTDPKYFQKSSNMVDFKLYDEALAKYEKNKEIAEEIEHIENSKFFNRMREILGDTSIDPHGSIIPDYDY